MTQAAILAASGSPGTTTGFKNRIINGNMAIAQRGTSAVTTDGSFPVDRFTFQVVNANLSLIQSATAPAGFNYSTAITITSATSSDTNDRSRFFQVIEGFNVADLGWGTANAKSISVSFWAQSTVAGTYSGNIQNNGGSRSYIFTYTLAANTWTYVTASIPGDTGGTWLTTNGVGIVLGVNQLNCGASYQGAAGSWIAGDARGTSGSTYLATTNSGAVFYVTGVQLEVGTTATNFDFRSIGTELALCQRYFYRNPNTSGSSSEVIVGGIATAGGQNAWISPTFCVTMRTSPTGTVSGTWVVSNCSRQPSIDSTSPYGFRFSTGSAGSGQFYSYNDGAGLGYYFSAEL